MKRTLWIGAGTVAAMLIAAAACRVDPPAAPSSDVTVKAVGDVAAVPDGPKPAIACDQAEFNFGTVVQGEDAKHVFTVKNTGDAPLKIESARGG